MYESAREVNDRLAGTVVLYCKAPIYIQEAGADGNGKLFLYTCTIPALRSGPHIYLDDPDLDIFGMQLGYINTKQGVCVYTKRMPTRRMQQGLNAQNVHIQLGDMIRDRINWNNLYNTQYFADALAGKYPTLKEARQMLMDNPDWSSVAFRRQFAIQREAPGFPFYLMYRGRRAGWSDLNCENFNLPEDHFFLREMMQQQGIAA